MRALSLMLATAAGVFLQDQVARQISWPLARLARCWPGCAVFDDHCCEFAARAGAMMPSLGALGRLGGSHGFAVVGVRGGSGGVRLDPASCGCSWLSGG